VIEGGKDCVAGRPRLYLLAEEKAKKVDETGQCEGAKAPVEDAAKKPAPAEPAPAKPAPARPAVLD
jgi:hypothetical protein